MKDESQGTVLLLKNAAAHAGQIKQELAAIIQVLTACAHLQHCSLRLSSVSAAQLAQNE